METLYIFHIDMDMGMEPVCPFTNENIYGEEYYPDIAPESLVLYFQDQGEPDFLDEGRVDAIDNYFWMESFERDDFDEYIEETYDDDKNILIVYKISQSGLASGPVFSEGYTVWQIKNNKENQEFVKQLEAKIDKMEKDFWG